MKACKINKKGFPCCPGCSRHCPMGSARCKYGKNYFAKHCPCPNTAELPCRNRGNKWKDTLEKGGLIFLLLKSGKRIKKALKRGEIQEETLLARLTPSEKETLERLLKKLEIQSE